MFPEIDEAAVQTFIETLPLYPYFKPAELKTRIYSKSNIKENVSFKLLYF
jgi:hypothetical protein